MPVTRFATHGITLLFFLVSIIISQFSVSPIKTATANNATPTPVIALLPDTSESDPLVDRGVLPTRNGPRTTPTPMPTPIPIDPLATPLPSPTPPPTPAPVAVATPPPAPAAPVAVSGAGWLWPVAGSSGVSTYFSSYHPALDIYGSCGTPVVATIGGTVVQSGWKNNGGGYVVSVQSGEFLVEYNHLNGIAASLGTVLPAGAVIGYVGATGIATGCHLHIAVMVNGYYVDPLSYL